MELKQLTNRVFYTPQQRMTYWNSVYTFFVQTFAARYNHTSYADKKHLFGLSKEVFSRCFLFYSTVTLFAKLRGLSTS